MNFSNLHEYQRVSQRIQAYDEAIIRIRARLESPRMSSFSAPTSVIGTGWKNDVIADGIADLLDFASERKSLKAECDELEENIKRATSQLPPRDAEIFRLRYYRGFTFDKIGKDLNISGATASRKHALIMASLSSNSINSGGSDEK